MPPLSNQPRCFSPDHSFSYEKMFANRVDIPFLTIGDIEYHCCDLLSQHDQLPPQFWWSFIQVAESRLAAANIISRGTANGDKHIGKYCSLRNEAFIEVRPEWNRAALANICEFEGIEYCYPPNEAGYNAAGNKNPLASQYLPRFFHHPQITVRKFTRDQHTQSALAQRVEEITSVYPSTL